MVNSRYCEELDRRNEGANHSRKVFQVHHELRGDFDSGILQFVVLLHLVNQAGDVCHKSTDLLLLGLAVNGEHDAFLFGSGNHVADWPDGEVDSLEHSTHCHFDATCVLPQKVENFKLVRSEALSVKVLHSCWKSVCQLLQKDVDFESLGHVALETVLLEATGDAIDADSEEEISVPLFAELRQVDSLVLLLLFQLMVREQLEIDDEVAKYVQHSILQVADLQAEVHPLQNFDVFFSFEQGNHHCCNFLDEFVKHFDQVIFFVVFGMNKAERGHLALVVKICDVFAGTIEDLGLAKRVLVLLARSLD